MNKFKNAHWWMLFAFIIMQTGFIKGYWMNWSNEPWIDHVHGFSAMGWYLLLIVQPYFATHKKMELHRLWGMLGLFLAGGTAFSALAVVSRNVETGDYGAQTGNFDPTFIYGVVTSDLVMILAFIIAVILAIIKRKKLNDHAIWMTSTVLYIMSAGLGRAVSVIFGMPIIDAINVSGLIIITAFIIMGLRLKQLQHPAIIWGIVVNLSVFPIAWLGKQQWYIDFLHTIMKY
jgi:hypothetical protein